MPQIREPSPGQPGLRECPDCGQFHTLPPALPRHATVLCRRCNGVLRRVRPNPLTRPLALSLSGLALLVAALVTPLMDMDLYGLRRGTAVIASAEALQASGLWSLGALVFLTLVVMPALKFGMLATVLAGLRLPRPPRLLRTLFRWYERIGPWAMIEVFLLGVLVAYSRVSGYARVDVGMAMYLLGGIVLLLVGMDASLDPDAVWEALARRIPAPAPAMPAHAHAKGVAEGAELVGCGSCGLVGPLAGDGTGRCPRCRHRLHRRKPHSVARTWALVIAAAALYVPANIYPVMTVTYFGLGVPDTIIGGCEELIARGLWPLALLVFVASITVPLLKLLSLTAMLVNVHFGWSGLLRDRTRLYRIVHAIGRWSMIDIFMLAVLVGLVRMGFVASVQPHIGATAFASVVVLTMLAAETFDPRLMWDQAAARHRRRTPRAEDAR